MTFMYFKNTESDSLEIMKDIMLRNHLVVDDLFRTMGVSRDAEFVTFEEFKNGLYKINITKH